MKSPIRDGPAIFKKSKFTMKKIMFNDKYGLTNAVLSGRKTMTRRILLMSNEDVEYLDNAFDWDLREMVIIDRYAQYKVGEIVAIAQSYNTIANSGHLEQMTVPANNALGFEFKPEYCNAGYNNKMFVKAELMPEHIRIEGVKIERLMNISDEDCIKEGVMTNHAIGWYYIPNLYVHRKTKYTAGPILFEHPNHAYLTLCKKLGMVINDTANPYVIAYTFKLFKETQE